MGHEIVSERNVAQGNAAPPAYITVDLEEKLVWWVNGPLVHMVRVTNAGYCDEKVTRL
jgi:hypothetical protein